jgi:hypothetical protein
MRRRATTLATLALANLARAVGRPDWPRQNVRSLVDRVGAQVGERRVLER